MKSHLTPLLSTNMSFTYKKITLDTDVAVGVGLNEGSHCFAVYYQLYLSVCFGRCGYIYPVSYSLDLFLKNGCKSKTIPVMCYVQKAIMNSYSCLYSMLPWILFGSLKGRRHAAVGSLPCSWGLVFFMGSG